ncbi:UDP-glycosyltransferase UGT5-like isoform X5 [Harmonia axyridis]|uniref:UDP-glycosyltransferase UGT5-like isoform X5 n=1 Tax=Harmonia axyridis TaxID=115357 RepID=UPI001E27878E|nr:UDP-glycosyltransferase UGT5-like isoform X5 [Harmonia axyridis]
MNVLILLLKISYIVVPSLTYNILAVFTHPGRSHQAVFGRIVRELVSRGNKVTVVVHYGYDIQNENYTQIVLEDLDKTGGNFFDLKMFEMPVVLSQMMHPFQLADLGLVSCSKMLSNPDVKELIGSQKKFDLILAEFFNSECVLGFVNKFRAPLVGVSTGLLMPWHGDRLGNPDNPGYIANSHLGTSSRMGFLDRCYNFVGTQWYKVVYWWRLNDCQKIIEEHFGKIISSLHELMKNTSLLLVNSHFSFAFSRPLVPSIVEISGVHLSSVKPLPTNIEKFINESKHGVIYFSLGSMIKGHTFPQEKKDAFLKAFARLPQRVLWKWENETMPGKPDNVMIQKWMPQFDILSHPNVKAFISHGGLLGTTEAVHCGVPMMVMPQYGDQYTNAKAVEANGGGVILYLKDATEEKVYNNLKTILDPEFRAKAKALSERFRDRPMSPMDTAIYWVEYVARHKGAPHMKTAAVDMPLYQYLLLDVLAFLGLILLVFSYISYKILSLVLRSVFSKKKVKQN